ncbi:MAG TPA: substrate-binding domain-containing protein [Saprospiraceae bacterium]|nr:substrate-binding domain-containing protein [Saprospiraceae bacterium]
MKLFASIAIWVSVLFLWLCPACKETTPEKKYRVGFAQCCDDPWRDVMNSEMYRELELHPELEFEMRVSGNESEKQVEQIREIVASGIDILIVSPNESKPLTHIIEEVYTSGTPVILIDRETDSELYTAYIGADNYEIGKTAGRYLANRLNGRGKIIEIQLPLAISPAIERSRGFKDGIAAAPGLEIAAVLETVGGLNDIEARFPDMLKRHSDVSAIFGHTDLLAETAYKIAKEQGRGTRMFFVGIDGIPGTGRGIQAVEDGILDASLLYPTGGAEAIRLAVSILNRLPYEKQNNLETIVINKDNARILHNQMKKVQSLQESIDEQMSNLAGLKSIYRNQRVYIFILLSSLLLSLVLGVFLWRSLRAKQTALDSLERKNQEILEHERQIMAMSDEVKQATQAKVDFFTNISHEFRTPLTLILGFAEDLLPSPTISKDVQQSLAHIRRNAFRLLHLVNQLMDFRKSESGQMKLRAAENDLIAFVKKIMESFGNTAQKRGIDFQLLSRLEQLPVWIDAGMMDKVLFNLLSNAFKFTLDGGKIYLTVAVDVFENRAKITVEDSGQGIQEEDLRHIFEPFYQGEERPQAGTGLGLALAKALVELHGGAIDVQSTKGRGSRFLVSLPLGNKHLRADQMTSENTAYLSHHDFLQAPDTDWQEISGEMENESAGRQILIIEDNEDLQLFLRKKLSASYQVLQATDGNEGLQKALDHTPDLIICDVMLPGMNGIEITRALKSDLRSSHIPVIMLSARSATAQQIEGAEAGADIYLTKPFNIHFLQASIRSLLLNRQMLREHFSKGISAFSTADAPALPAERSANALDVDFVRQFADYMERHYARQDFQVSDLCREFGLSRSQIYRKVTALLGESISDYLQNIRLKKAEVLLAEGHLPVAEIAYQVGYSSPDYFSTVFRSRYGVPPSSFRREANT